MAVSPVLADFADFDSFCRFCSNSGQNSGGFSHFFCKIRQNTSSFWRVFDLFSDKPNVHDFEVDFQFERFCHIYRGAGKSTLHLVFYSIPYSRGPEIGGLVYHFGSEMSDLDRKVSPRVSKTVIFRDFFVIFWENGQKVACLWLNPAKLAKNGQNSTF